MIFVTVGTTDLSFNRLIQAADDLARVSEDEFVIQIGHSIYEPLDAQWFRFDDPGRIQQFIAQAEVVVTHGGFAAISDCLRARRRIVACPRRTELGEAVNPQHELVNYLAERGLLIALAEVTRLAEAIEQARQMPAPSWPFESRIPELVAQFVGDIESARSARLHA